MMRFSKDASDKNYPILASYMKQRNYSDTAASNIHLVFVISQSEEALDAHELLLGRELPIVESFHDLDASIELVQLGFHKQSVASLRMALDNGLLSTYWNAVGYDTSDFKRWMSSDEMTPRKDARFWKPIRRLPGVEAFYQTFSFKAEITDITDRLNDYVHTRGFRHSTRGEFQRRIRTQNEYVDCDDWYRMFVATTRIIVALQLLVKPKLAIVVPHAFLLRKFGSHDQMPFCGVLFGDYSDQIKLCVGEAEHNAISEIADTRPEVKDVWDYLHSCPDLRNDEIRQINYRFWKSQGLDDEAAKNNVHDTLQSIRAFEHQ